MNDDFDRASIPLLDMRFAVRRNDPRDEGGIPLAPTGYVPRVFRNEIALAAEPMFTVSPCYERRA